MYQREILDVGMCLHKVLRFAGYTSRGCELLPCRRSEEAFACRHIEFARSRGTAGRVGKLKNRFWRCMSALESVVVLSLLSRSPQNSMVAYRALIGHELVKCAKPKRSAPSMIMLVAFGINTFTTLVLLPRCLSYVLKSFMTASFQPGSSCCRERFDAPVLNTSFFRRFASAITLFILIRALPGSGSSMRGQDDVNAGRSPARFRCGHCIFGALPGPTIVVITGSVAGRHLVEERNI